MFVFSLFINKIANIAQYKSMAWGIVVILIETVLTIVFYPIKINVKAHASLDRKSLQLNLSVLKIPIVRLRGNLTKEPYLQINGKKAKIKDNSISVDAVKGAIDYAREQKLLKYFNIIALLALDDAKNSAILCAIVALLPLGISVYGFVLSPETFKVLLKLSEEENYKANVIVGWLSPLNQATFQRHNFGYDMLPTLGQSTICFLILFATSFVISARLIRRYSFKFTGTEGEA